MAHEDPLVSNNSVIVAVQITPNNLRGRPTRSKAIRFCPQPKSIVSQLLSNITKNHNNKTGTSCDHIEIDESSNNLFPTDTVINIDYCERNYKQSARNGQDDINISEDYLALSPSQIDDESHEDNLMKANNKTAKCNVRKARKILRRNARMKTKTFSDDLPNLSTNRCNDDREVSEHCCGHTGCDYKSKLLTNLTKHQRLHSNEKPYMCDQCTFRTNYVNSLKAHKRTHTSEWPYCCHECGYRCNSTSNLKKHFLHKHRTHKNTI